jgi:hypothetical protein
MPQVMAAFWGSVATNRPIKLPRRPEMHLRVQMQPSTVALIHQSLRSGTRSCAPARVSLVGHEWAHRLVPGFDHCQSSFEFVDLSVLGGDRHAKRFDNHDLCTPGVFISNHFVAIHFERVVCNQFWFR